jgi:predicted nuclease of predicted toxin-antitoxin system
MKILFDQGTPVPLRSSLDGHQVETAFERGWNELTNGELLSAAEAEGFDILITTDQNLQYQQDLSERKIAIIVLKTTSWPKIKDRSVQIADAAASIRSSDYIEIEFV